MPSETYIITHLFIIGSLSFAAWFGTVAGWLTIRWLDRKNRKNGGAQ